jgi:hypothetical protein
LKEIFFSYLNNPTSKLQALSSREVMCLSQNVAMTLLELQYALKDGYDKWEKIKLVQSCSN